MNFADGVEVQQSLSRQVAHTVFVGGLEQHTLKWSIAVLICLLLGSGNFLYLVHSGDDTPPQPTGTVAGERYKFCFTATDYDNSTGTPIPISSTEKCTYATVVGKCTLYTADVNTDETVDSKDRAAMASLWLTRSNSTRAEDINDDGLVDQADSACVDQFWGQYAGLP